MIERWVLDKLEPLRNEPVILLHDPQRMLPVGSTAIGKWAEQHQFVVIVPSGNLAFRDQFEQIRENDGLKLILVDRTRESDGRKAKLPLFYPDLDARCRPKARQKLTLREFLVEKTGDQYWPPKVNDRHLSRLILQNLEAALIAHNHLRKADPQRFTDSDLYKVVLGACLAINPFLKRLNSNAIRSLCVERHGQIEEVRSLLENSGVEAEDVLGILKKAVAKADKPWCWMLDHDPQDVIRGFTLASILHQHGLNYRVLLSNFDPSLRRYSDVAEETITTATEELLASNPDALAADVARVEDFLKEEPQDRLAFLLEGQLRISEPEHAKKVLLAEKLSPLIRTLTLVSLLADLLVRQDIAFHQSVISALDDEGGMERASLPLAARRPTSQWANLRLMYERAIRYFGLAGVLKEEARKLKVSQTDRLQFDWFHTIWTEHGADRHDFYSTQLQRLLRVGDLIPLNNDQLWPTLRSKWDQAKPKLEEIIARVQADLDVVNAKFQDLYRASYLSWIKDDDAPCVFTHQFVPRFLKPHWHYTDGKKAVVLIFDGLRTDAWEELVRPVLEEQYEITESHPASAILPSETHLSRKAIAAGCMPIDFSSTSEKRLFEHALKTHLALDVQFDVVVEDEDQPLLVRRLEGREEPPEQAAAAPAGVETRPPATIPAVRMLGEYEDNLRAGRFQKLIELRPPLQGFELGPELITFIGGPPGGGKTAVAMQAARDALELNPGLSVTVANAESSFRGLLTRQLASITGISGRDIRFGNLTDGDQQKLIRALVELTPQMERMSVLAVPHTLEQLMRLVKEPPGLLVVDYLQKFSPPGAIREGVNAVVGGLRLLAQEGWAVLCLAATARTTGKGGNGHDSSQLGLSFFRDSSEIEFNGDSAYLLRDETPAERDEYGRDVKRDLVLAHVKNRWGPLVDHPMVFDGPRLRVEPMPHEVPEWNADDPFAGGDDE